MELGCAGGVEVSQKGAPRAAPGAVSGVGRQQGCPGAVGPDPLSSQLWCQAEPEELLGDPGGACLARYWQNLLRAVYGL